MSDACANPDCGHPKMRHIGYASTDPQVCEACPCPAFVADGGRPTSTASGSRSATCTAHDWRPLQESEKCRTCGRERPLLTAPADQAVTDVLAKVLAEQRWQGHYLILNGWSERTRQEVASTLAAVLSERFVITPKEST